MIDEHRALNKQQLAAALGVPKTWLWKQRLPFQGGRLSLADARRILRRRQDQMERDRIKCQPVALGSEDDPRWQAIERRFDGDRSRKR